MPWDGKSATERFYDELCAKEFAEMFKRKERQDAIEKARREPPHTCPVCNGTGVDINDESGTRFCPNCHGCDDWWEDQV